MSTKARAEMVTCKEEFTLAIQAMPLQELRLPHMRDDLWRSINTKY
jgi:hypothetical protein